MRCSLVVFFINAWVHFLEEDLDQILGATEAEVRGITSNSAPIAAAKGDIPEGSFPEPMMEDVPSPSGEAAVQPPPPAPIEEITKVAEEKAPTVG
ncbi:UNVERIFIED_CONTAM: hypothetical protein Slati_3520100 [Sesamum latifolium]|uniref:Uncharacterized protein n=1 Tax=Sesamum latifolium TaxID=2727402 RepID=A0AAW2UKI0_9LAMI